MKLYLAHSTESREKVREWELNFEKETGINLVNPFYDVERHDIPLLDKGDVEGFKRECHPKEVVERDIRLIKDSDAILFLLNELSIGTIMEIVYAKILHKTIYVITDKFADHTFIRYHADKIFSSLEEFKSFAESSLSV